MVSQAHFKFLQNMLAVTNITGIIAPRENKSNWKYDDVMSWKYGKKCLPKLCGSCDFCDYPAYYMGLFWFQVSATWNPAWQWGD